MKRIGWWLACCALWTPNLWGQEEPVQVRVRAIAGPDGKVEVIEEKVTGDPKEGSESKKYLPKVSGRKGENEEEAEGEKGVRATVIRKLIQSNRAAAEDQKALAEKFAAEQPPLPSSDYWIGVQIGDLAPEIRKHMAVKHGILVQHVYPDSPAAKAELQADDVLVQAGDTKIESPADLIKAVDATKDKALTLKLLREGAEKTLKVTPTKRPTEEATDSRVTTARVPTEKLHEAQQALEKALEAIKEQGAETAAVDFMLVRPGAYVYGQPHAQTKLPDNVTVQITKAGSKPASIRITQGDKTYEATEGKLDGIPAELRPHIERMLAGGPAIISYSPAEGQRFEMKLMPPVAGGRLPARVAVPVPVPPAVPGLPGAAPVPVPAPTTAPIYPSPPTPSAAPSPARVAWYKTGSSDSSDAKLDQILKKLDALASPDLEAMRKEIKALRKAVDDLQKKASGSESSRER